MLTEVVAYRTVSTYKVHMSALASKVIILQVMVSTVMVRDL